MKVVIVRSVIAVRWLEACIILFAVMAADLAFCAESVNSEAGEPRPSLVVLIVVDQLRYDALERYRSEFGDGGFERMRSDGAVVTSARYQHATTDTCPGHAVVMTGTSPAKNGIVANEWLDRDLGRPVYCVENGSLDKLDRPTIGDLLKKQSGGRSRVVAISGKDEVAAVMSGQKGDAAFWVNDRCQFTGSFHNRAGQGEWASDFVDGRRIKKFFGMDWERVLAVGAYASLGPDDQPGEIALDGLGRTFPHPLTGSDAEIGSSFCRGFNHTPFANDVLADFAMGLITNERLGLGDSTDFLAIGFSAIDAIGHRYGPFSHEMFDAVIRFDMLLERLIHFLDQQVGLDDVLIVLTSDHGVAPLPETLQKIDSGGRVLRMSGPDIVRLVTATLDDAFGKPESGHWVRFHDYPNIYLNEQALRNKHARIDDAENMIKQVLQKLPAIGAAFTRSELLQGRTSTSDSDIARAVLLSFHPQRSGNIVYQVRPFHLIRSQGANHGTPWEYDTHVPMLWYGKGVRRGIYDFASSPLDIAPTLAEALGIPQAPDMDGRVMYEILEPSVHDEN